MLLIHLRSLEKSCEPLLLVGTEHTVKVMRDPIIIYDNGWHLKQNGAAPEAIEMMENLRRFRNMQPRDWQSGEKPNILADTIRDDIREKQGRVPYIPDNWGQNFSNI